MKKAEQYLMGIERDGFYTPLVEVIRVIKQAQQDAIDLAVKECAENASIKIEYLKPTRDCSGHHKAIIDKQSILQVADKLLKQI